MTKFRSFLAYSNARRSTSFGENEPILTTMGISLCDLNDDALIHLCVTYPILIERPIVVHQGAACIGRPIENVVQLLTPSP